MMPLTELMMGTVKKMLPEGLAGLERAAEAAPVS